MAVRPFVKTSEMFKSMPRRISKNLKDMLQRTSQLSNWAFQDPKGIVLQQPQRKPKVEKGPKKENIGVIFT